MTGRDLDGSVASRTKAWCAALIATGLFAALCSPRLTAQGMHDFEGYGVGGSFVITGMVPQGELASYGHHFSVHGIPFLQETYVGFIKPLVYGLYLRLSGHEFSVLSMRLLGILTVSLGLLCFCAVAVRRLPALWLMIFLPLLLTDITVLLWTRYSWATQALTLLLCLLFLATWIQGETGRGVSVRNTCLLGVWVGFALFQKLVHVVLVVPLFLMLLLSDRRRSLRHWLWALGGGLLGASPLIFVNLYSFLTEGFFVSNQYIDVQPHLSVAGFIEYVSRCFRLGSGVMPRLMIFGALPPPLLVHAEGLFMTGLLVLTAIITLSGWRRNHLMRMSGIALLSYILLILCLYVLPGPYPTEPRHWMIATPFLYAAIACAVVGVSRAGPLIRRSDRVLRTALGCMLALFVIPRAIGLVSLEQSLVRGVSSEKWNPAPTRFAQFAKEQADRAAFLTVDWGLGALIYCFANGQPHVVYECGPGCSANRYRGVEYLREITEDSEKSALYLVMHQPPWEHDGREMVFDQMAKDMEHLPGWAELDIEREISGLHGMAVRKFVKSTPHHGG